MTDTTRADFEELVKSRNGENTRLLFKNSDGDYNALEIGFGWVAYQAATLKERERCAGICMAQAEAAKKAGNTQYQIGCLECLDEIGSGQ